jgi:phosphatidylinositol 4-kinase
MMTTRSSYAGEVAGMLNRVRGEITYKQQDFCDKKSTNTLVNQLIDELWRACRNKDENEHHCTLWRATALLISIPGKTNLLYNIKHISKEM